MPGQLSVNDRVLLHLSKFATDTPPEEYPEESTQVGIADGVGISRTHVPRAVKTLIREGLVEEHRGRVSDRERRMSVYAVTPEGFRKAEGLWETVRASKLTVVRDGEPTEMPGSALEDLVGRRRAVGLISCMKDDTVELDDRRRAPVRNLLSAPAREEFFGRQSELDALTDFLKSDSRVMVVMGGRGFGTTSLVLEFVDSLETVDVLWLTLQEGMTAEDVEGGVVGFAVGINPEVGDIDGALALTKALLVFDGYHSVKEDVVELFSQFTDVDGQSKIIVISREDTPVYSRFYQREDVRSDVVRELRVKGLDEESSKKLLGNPDIDSEAFRRVYLMTRGQPRLLRLLRDGLTEELKRESVFTAEEIRYLVFLRDKTS